MSQSQRVQRTILGVANDGRPKFLITLSREEAEQLWPIVSRGEYWIDGRLFMSRPGLTRDERIQCEQLFLVQENRQHALKVETKRKRRF